MQYEVLKGVDGDWRVETIDHDSEGECYVSLFPGLDGERRAREYAAFKNAGSVVMPGAPVMVGAASPPPPTVSTSDVKLIPKNHAMEVAFIEVPGAIAYEVRYKAQGANVWFVTRREQPSILVEWKSGHAGDVEVRVENRAGCSPWVPIGPFYPRPARIG